MSSLKQFTFFVLLGCFTVACADDHEGGAPCASAACDVVEDAMENDVDASSAPDVALDTAQDHDLTTADVGGDADGFEDTSDTTPIDVTPTAFFLSGPDHLALPYASLGEAQPTASLQLIAGGDLGSLGVMTLSVEGPFEVSGSSDPFAVDEVRSLTVLFTGDASTTTLAEGMLIAEVDDQRLEITLSAVICDPGLPSQPGWEQLEGYRRRVLSLPSAPFPHPGTSWTDDSVMIVVPDGASTTQPLELVHHFHGHGASLEQTIANQHLVEQFIHADRDAVLIVPQGPVMASSGDFGKLMLSGGFESLLNDAVCALYRDAITQRASWGHVALTAHSGGYLALATVLGLGEVEVDTVHLFDALYAREATYLNHVSSGGRLRSNYTAGGGTLDNNQTLQSMLDADGVSYATQDSDRTLLAENVVITATDASHSASIWVDRVYTRWLRTSGLRASWDAAPELRVVSAQNGSASVSWLEEGDASPRRYQVQGSSDQLTWTVLGEAQETSLQVAESPWIRVVAVDDAGRQGRPSNAYAGEESGWLVVDGFDRALTGSWTHPTHDFTARLGTALGGASSASNEAVTAGEVDLGGFSHVLWMLGDEGSDDHTFTAAERAAIEAFLAGGGHLIVSGAEVGYASDRAWLSSVLHVDYVSDDAGVSSAAGFDFGVVYPEDYPDVLSGASVIWSYDNGAGAAAVGWDGQIIVVGFPLESIEPSQLDAALSELAAWL